MAPAVEESTIQAKSLSALGAAAGIAICGATLGPAFTLRSSLYDSGIATVKLSGTPDGPVFHALGGLILFFSLVSFFTGHTIFRILAGFTGLAVTVLCVLGENKIWDRFGTPLDNTSTTLSFTALLLTLGIFGTITLLASYFSGRLNQDCS